MAGVCQYFNQVEKWLTIHIGVFSKLFFSSWSVMQFISQSHLFNVRGLALHLTRVWTPLNLCHSAHLREAFIAIIVTCIVATNQGATTKVATFNEVNIVYIILCSISFFQSYVCSMYFWMSAHPLYHVSNFVQAKSGSEAPI